MFMIKGYIVYVVFVIRRASGMSATERDRLFALQGASYHFKTPKVRLNAPISDLLMSLLFSSL